MNKGNITITENGHDRFIVEVALTDGELLLTVHEMADLFGVFVSAVGSNLRAIFKSGLLKVEEVCRTHRYEQQGKVCEVMLYSMEAILMISYRLTSPQARAFRRWVIRRIVQSDRFEAACVPNILMIQMTAGKGEIA